MTNQDLNRTINNLKEAWKYPELFENISKSERWLSGAVGTYLFYKGIKGIFSHPVFGLTSAAIGTGLLYRSITGYCPIKDISEQAKESITPDEIILTETYVVDDLA